ncbi:MAG: hypothetical protein PHP13_06080 [Methanomicrobium sp.]|nr:hypothetical protein [Methanomicrobium sp.]MDD4299651.1 hypothetical protein [Methanomicrobium sp.]
MEEKKGHFEKGRWIEDMPGEDTNNENDKFKSGEGKNSEDDIDRIISETTESVKTAVESVISLGNTLFGTKEGRLEIEKKAKAAGSSFIKSLEDAIEEAKKNL